MRLISIILATIISFMSTSITFADSNNTKTYNFEDDVKMTGVISSNQKTFNIDDNWNVKNAKVNLVFTKSELLDVNYSTITVFVNNTPVKSLKLDGKKIYKKESAISIPTDVLTSGYNNVTIKGYKTLSDAVCKDDANTANWLVLHKESNINLEYTYKKNSNLISKYQDTYINTDNGSNLNTTILLPDKYTSAELSSAMILGTSFSHNLKYENFNFDLKTYTDYKSDNNNVIYIGKENNTDKNLLALLTKSEKNNLNKNCVIKQTTSPFNKNKKILLIISNNDKLLKNASKLLSSDDLVDNLNDSSITINENTDISDLDDYEDNSRLYLKKLGYENLKVEGPFSQELSFDINTPKNKIVTSDSKLKFYMRYSDNLDFNSSLVTVYINDKPIGSKQLTKDNSNNDYIELNLPEEVLEKNYYQIKIVFNLNIIDLKCSSRESNNPWAYITDKSYIDFSYKENNDLSFANYPFPFVENEKLNNVNVIIPDNLTSKDLTNISNIVSFLGKDINYNNGNLNIIKISELKNSNKKGNLIVIGSPKNNTLIKDLNKNLNIKFDKEFTKFEDNEKIKFINDFSKTITSMQLIKSPYENNSNILVITGINTDLSLCNNYLNDLSVTKTLTGDTILVGLDGYIKDLSYNISNKEEKIEEKTEKKSLSKQSMIFIILAVFLFITIITSIILVIKKYK